MPFLQSIYDTLDDDLLTGACDFVEEIESPQDRRHALSTACAIYGYRNTISNYSCYSFLSRGPDSGSLNQSAKPEASTWNIARRCSYPIPEKNAGGGSVERRAEQRVHEDGGCNFHC